MADPSQARLTLLVETVVHSASNGSMHRCLD